MMISNLTCLFALLQPLFQKGILCHFKFSWSFCPWNEIFLSFTKYLIVSKADVKKRSLFSVLMADMHLPVFLEFLKWVLENFKLCTTILFACFNTRNPEAVRTLTLDIGINPWWQSQYSASQKGGLRRTQFIPLAEKWVSMHYLERGV